MAEGNAKDYVYRSRGNDGPRPLNESVLNTPDTVPITPDGGRPSSGGYFSCKEGRRDQENTTPFSPSEMDTSEDKENMDSNDRDMIRKVLVSSAIQEVVDKVNLAGQNLLVATNKMDRYDLRRRARVL